MVGVMCGPPPRVWRKRPAPTPIPSSPFLKKGRLWKHYSGLSILLTQNLSLTVKMWQENFIAALMSFLTIMSSSGQNPICNMSDFVTSDITNDELLNYDQREELKSAKNQEKRNVAETVSFKIIIVC